MKTNIGISDENRQAIADALAKILADEYVLYTKTRNAHWNVEGPDFYDKHKFFEGQYEQLATIVDSVAERIRTLGHYAPATLKEFLELTHLTEREQNDNSAQGFIKELLQDHETICIHLREVITPFAETYQDLGTSDFVTGLLEEHEKTAWFLRAHLK
ncbi:DNA starvation/stationary phase protection protein [Maribacter polysiphoniae]|uniref:DNA starvation/stationary phase protection protein n=1 Tax=Maribacter polysiphoniae TaxID=429344 RepID=A0A316DQ20_9FLAO|nr:DNA starvation/stationary phase protection protein [Maribacter polysiphoniae]MBD1262855.1 DNA starvation/stationary phase protection protein [Maribacter polysiphoniae]PWK20171.1 starvation-inducible DNA-binding protein [Maribacter polysiphoniae]